MSRALQLIMSLGTLVLGLYLVLVGSAVYAPYGWFLAALGALGVAARFLLPDAGSSRSGRPPR